MTPRKIALQAACILAFTSATLALADTVVLDNGDRLTGTVNRMDGGKLVINTKYAGDVAIDPAQIAEVKSDNDVTVIMQDRTRVIGQLNGSGKALMVQSSAAQAPRPIKVAEVQSLTPGRVERETWKYSGHVNIGWSDSSGNTDTSRAHADVGLIARKGDNRVTTGLAGDQASDNGSETASNATGFLKYDRFFSKKWYGYVGTTLEHDRFKDIQLRNTLGVGAGHQFFESSRTNLSVESGIDYVYTDYYSAQTEAFPAWRVGVRFDHFIIPQRLQFFHTSEGYMSLEDVKKSFARTQTGLRFPLISNFVATTQVNLDWDGDPAPGRKSVDQTLLFTLGYVW